MVLYLFPESEIEPWGEEESKSTSAQIEKVLMLIFSINNGQGGSSTTLNFT